MKFKALVYTLVVISALAATAAAQDKTRFRAAVEAQRDSDVKNKNEIISKMNTVLGKFNKRLQESGVKDADLVNPVNEKVITDVNETEDYHSAEKKPAVTAFAADKADLYDLPGGTIVVGKVSFGEGLELVEKTPDKSSFKGKSGRWFLARMSNGNEGWIHSSMLSKKKLSKTDKEPVKIKDDEPVFESPVSGRRTSNFGSRVDPVTKRRQAFHSGIDIAAPMGTPVSAAESGVIRLAGYKKSGYGNLIIIEHPKGFVTYYGHLSKMNARVGDKVKKGDNIGAVGSTGKSTGPHLHFEVRRGDKALDPDSYVR